VCVFFFAIGTESLNYIDELWASYAELYRESEEIETISKMKLT
jgi:hypothetical protein